MTFIQRHDGTTYDLLNYGIRTRDLLISGPTPNHEFGQVDGANGVVDYGTTYGPRNITALYRATSSDITDFSLLRDEIFNIFRTEESFYLIEKRLPGKRWLAKVSNPYQIRQRNIFGNFDVDFIGIMGVAESIGTTADIDRDGLNYGDGWSYGMGLLYNDESHKYTHAGASFRIYNAGNVPVHPFEQDLVIRIISLKNTSEPYELRNVTNGSVFRINDGLSMGQTVMLDGPNITSNGAQFLRETNRGFIELDSGWNEFEVTGGDMAVASFDFRFYYL